MVSECDNNQASDHKNGLPETEDQLIPYRNRRALGICLGASTVAFVKLSLDTQNNIQVEETKFDVVFR